MTSAPLNWVMETLWAPPASASLTRPLRGARSSETFAVLPNAAHPRLLVPLGSRRAASHALREYTPGKTSVRLAKPLLAWGLRSGLARPLLRDRVHVGVIDGVPIDGLSDVLLKEHLRDVLGRPDLELAVKFDAPRPQRKPILHLLGRDGRAVGFGKVAWNDVTRALLANEVLMLQQFKQRARRPREFVVPELLYAGRWRDLELMIVAPISFGSRRRFLPHPPPNATDEVGQLGGAARMPLVDSDHWQGTLRRVAATHALCPSEPVPRLHDAAQEIERRYGSLTMAFGSWHGDWVPWNMAHHRGALHVWDWERGGPHAPRGLDAIHFDYQAELGLRKTAPAQALGATLRRSGDLLGTLNVDPASGPPLLALHLLEMSLRFDEARSAGVSTADPKYLPALEHLLRGTPAPQER
jgi:hypothetical protein